MNCFKLWPWSEYGVIYIVVGGLTYWYWRSWYRLRHIPGPFLASLSYLWIAIIALSGRYSTLYRDANRRYGPLVRIGPYMLATDDPDVIRKLSSTRSQTSRDPWYLAGRWDPYQKTMFNLLDPESHDRMKAKVAKGYAGGSTEALEEGIDEVIEELLSLVRRKYISLKSGPATHLLDFARLSSFISLDTITRVAFGSAFGYLSTDSDVYGFFEQVRRHWPFMHVTLEVPWVRQAVYSSIWLRLYGPKMTDRSGIGKLMSVSHEAIKKRFAAGAEDKDDIVGYFIRHGMTQRECEAESLFMMIAGSDTTASAIRVTMLYIITNPRVYCKLKNVILTEIRANRVSNPIRYEEAKGIKYLQAIIYEGLRMRSPAPGPYPKRVSPEGETIHGLFVAGGTPIGMNTGSLLRSKERFGEDAGLFRPERFMEVSEAERTEMERMVELVFGYGRWMCAGKAVAWMEINKVIWELMRCFDFQLAYPTHPWDSSSYNVFIEDNMWVKVTEASFADE